MREFLSKSIAGGLSAGVVLLWWPVLFDEVDSVTSWFVRGVAWTVCFELLLFALIPFERALWDTPRAERIVQRVGSAGSRIDSGSSRRRIGRLSAGAGVALAVPVVLRVTKVVRPVTVKKIVEQTPAQQEYTPPAPQATPAPVPPRTTEKPAPTNDRTVVGGTAPVQRQTAPKEPAEAAPLSAPGAQGGDSG